MWVRQCDLDAQLEAPSPIPTRIASNEEFLPPPQSPQQKEFEARLAVLSEHDVATFAYRVPTENPPVTCSHKGEERSVS